MTSAYEVIEKFKQDYDKEAAIRPAMMDLVGVPQDPEWHPEGDVANHTKEVFFKMVAICDRDELTGEARLIHEMAALGHDMGKPECTKEKTFTDGSVRWVSPMHDNRVHRLMEFMETMEIETGVFDAVIGMTKMHMRHIGFKNGRKKSAEEKEAEKTMTEKEIVDKIVLRKKPVAKLVRQLRTYQLTVYDLDRMVEADISGRFPLPARKSLIMQKIIKFVEDEKHITKFVENDAITVTGKFLIETMKVPPSKQIGVIVATFKGKTFETEGEMEQIVFEWMEDEKVGGF